MTVVGPDFAEAGVQGGGDVNGVGASQKHVPAECPHRGFNSPQETLGYRQKPPSTGIDIIHEQLANFRHRFRRKVAFPKIAMKKTGHFGQCHGGDVQCGS